MRYFLLPALVAVLVPVNAAPAATPVCALFSKQDAGPLKRPTHSHTFAAFALVRDDGTVESAFTISWLPGGDVHLLEGRTPGANRSLADSLAAASADGMELAVWGPYPMDPKFFAAAELRWRELQAGSYSYKALDEISRKLPRQPGVNCIHAVGDIAGPLATGTLHGQAATQAVVDHFLAAGAISRAPIPHPEVVARELGIDRFPHAARP